MRRAASLMLLLCTTAIACAHGGQSHRRPSSPPVPADATWTPIGLRDVADPTLRRAIHDLLLFVDVDHVWPGFTLSGHPVIVVDSRDARQSIAYCIGDCVPRLQSRGGTSRIWRRTTADTMTADDARLTPLADWGLGGSGDILSTGFRDREQIVETVLHEHFHVHYQSDYATTFGDGLRGDGNVRSGWSRADLESSYSGTEPVTTELRNECAALVDALRAGRRRRTAAFAALQRFIAAREMRRARPGAPGFEEDFWERQEGVPVNLERRIAKHLQFRDPSLIETGLTSEGCELIPRASYLLLLGGLQGAVLDELGDTHAWPIRVYPRDGSAPSSLYLLVRELLNEER